jgi:U2-associated protein SR140
VQVDALYESLTLPPSESTIEKKLARLYLVSDILHNSSAPFPKTARFRSLLQPKLATIMGSCREALMSMEGRMAAENIKAKVGRMLDVWDKWSLYPPHSLHAFDVL